MKPDLLTLLALFATAALAHSEELPSAPIEATTARIIGEIPDGTPAPTTPPPEYIVPAKDILETTVHQLNDGTTVTINRIKPIDLPPPINTDAPPTTAPQALPTSLNTPHPTNITLSLGATVYRSANLPPRSLVTYRPHGNGQVITFWSSADVSILTGITSFLATDGTKRQLYLMCHSENTDTTAEFRTQHGLEYQAPEIPTFPEGKATYQIVGSPPAAEILVPIQSLHDLYNTNFQQLLTAYQGRERARLQHEANPPQPQNITLNYWHTEKPAPAAEGAAQ